MRWFQIIILMITTASFSQNKQILYGFSEIPQSLLLNPGGIVENKGYFGVPLLSQIHFNTGSSGSTVYDVFADNGIDFNTKLQNAIYSMDANDYFTFNQQLEIFSGGFAFGRGFEKNEYFSFGLYEEVDVISYFPKDYAVLALEGNQNRVNKSFNAGDFSASAEIISVLHAGYNKKVNNTFTYGFRAKIYSNLININSTNNNGYFFTTDGQNNTYNHIFNLDLELKTSGLASLREEGSDSQSTIKDLKKRLLFGGNLGFGFDMGFTKKLTDQWTIDGSLLDIGFISHTKDIETYTINGNYTFEGINPIFPERREGQTADEYWSDIEEEFEDLFDVDTINKTYTTWRPIKLNASINYAFGEKKCKTCSYIKQDIGYLNAVGLQLFAINRPKRPQAALTAYYYRRLFKALRIKATYTVDGYTFNNIGLGVSAHLGSFNFYAMADNFLQYQNLYDAQSVSLQLGFNYIFNTK